MEGGKGGGWTRSRRKEGGLEERKEGTARGAWLGGQGSCSRARLVCGFLWWCVRVCGG